MRDPIAELVENFAHERAVPLAWAMLYAPDGDVAAALTRAWDACADPVSLLRLLATVHAGSQPALCEALAERLAFSDVAARIVRAQAGMRTGNYNGSSFWHLHTLASRFGAALRLMPEAQRAVEAAALCRGIRAHVPCPTLDALRGA